MIILYPGTENPRVIFNLDNLAMVKIRELNPARYDIMATTGYYSFVVSGPFDSKIEAETALKEFYEFLTDYIQNNRIKEHGNY